MPEDYYSNPDDTEPTSADDSESSMDEKDESEGETTLIPKSIFGSHKCKVGDIKKFKVVHEYEDEVEVEYAGKEHKPKDEERTMANAQDELSAMDS